MVKQILVLVLALLVAAPVFAQPTTRCWIVADSHGHKHYACATGDNVPSEVNKVWFKQHCTSYDPAYETDQSAAQCDQPPAALQPNQPIATPPGFWHKVKIGLEYSGAAAIFIVFLMGEAAQ